MASIQESLLPSPAWPLSIPAFIAAVSLFLFSIWAVFVSLRNAYFHPLSNFPGPKLAAATPIPFVKRMWDGDMVKWVMDLHARYGEVVRVSPDELSFISPSAWQDIYATKPQLPKPNKANFLEHNGVASMLTQTIPEEHNRQRRILGNAFSERALKSQEDILKHYTDLLITRLKEEIAGTEKSSLTLDISKWYSYTTFDLVGDLLFNDPFHSLETAADHERVTAIFASIKFGAIFQSFDHFPPLLEIAKALLPPSIKEAAKRHFSWTQEKITKRIETKTERPDFMTYVLRNNEGEEKMTRDEMDSNGALLVLAGSDTSATTCSSSTFYFLKNRAVYDRLAKEVRDAFSSADDITVASAGRLPYLHAVIREALRLHPTGPVSVPRLVDRPGVKISGYDVPVGTRVGIPQKTMSRSPINFTEPSVFAAERWLPEADPKYDGDHKDASEPFMVGPRNCLGKSLAWAEMNLILCKMLYHFDMELGEDYKGDWSMEQKVWVLHQRTPLFVKLTPRHRCCGGSPI